METIVYLIRHSVRLNMKNNIESYNTTQESLIKSEKIILSVAGGLYLFVLNASIGGKHETEEYFIRNIHTYEWN